MLSVFSSILILAAVAAALLMLLSDSWRWTIAGLAIQYLVVFLLVAQIWPIGLAAIKLVAGWLAGVLLSMVNSPAQLEETFFSPRSARIFRLFSAGMILMIVFAVIPSVNILLPIPYHYLLIGLMLIGMGVLQFGISQLHLRVILGLLTLLSGFEVIYSCLEGSALLAAILAAITLALGLIGSTILMNDQPKEKA
jgi:hypothetical protein